MHPEKLGPYDVVQPLGSGGMGTVYEAVSSTTGERVALKLLHNQFAGNERMSKRFRAEIETLKQLKHPRIVRICGQGETDGHLYYAMELVEGKSVAEEIDGGKRFELRETCKIGIELCDALKHAHERGIIHRDLKPSNIVMDTGGSIKLADFGIARVFGSESLTVDGALVGTPSYLSPEQVAHGGVTEQSDLYSLGCVLYAMMSGGPPFRGESAMAVIQAHLSQAPEDLRRRVPWVPSELADLVMKLLSKDPADRIRTAYAVSRKLRYIQENVSGNSSGVRVSAGQEASDSEAASVATQTIESGSRSTSIAVPKPQLLGETSSVYTDIEPSEEARESTQSWRTNLFGVVGLSAFLLTIVVSVLAMSQMNWFQTPTNANEQYAEIRRTNPAGASLERLTELKKLTDQFQIDFPNHRRLYKVQHIANETSFYLYKAQLCSRESDQLSELERFTQEGLNESGKNQGAALAALQTLVDSIPKTTANEPQERTYCRRIASEEIERLEQLAELRYVTLVREEKQANTKERRRSVSVGMKQYLSQHADDKNAAQIRQKLEALDWRIYELELVERTSLSPQEARLLKSLNQIEDQPGLALKELKQLAATKNAGKCGDAARYHIALIESEIDALHDELIELVKEGDDALAKKRGKLDHFIQNFGSDPRHHALRGHLIRLDVGQLNAKLSQVVAKQGVAALSPIQRMYFSTIRLMGQDSAAGRRRLQSIVDLYSKPNSELDHDSLICIRSAQQQLSHLAKSEERFRDVDLAEIDRQLGIAKKLEQSDPESARNMYQAIIELFQDAPWAQERVQTARKRLQLAIEHAS